MSTPQSNFTLECEQALNNCKTLAEFNRVKEANKNKIIGSDRLSSIADRVEKWLKEQKPNLSIKQPVLDGTPKGSADLGIDGEGGYYPNSTV